MAVIVYAYTRVSTNRQGEIGLDAQQLVNQTYWERYLKPDYPEILHYADADVSARQYDFAKRPKAKELMMRVTKGDAILFPKLDRAFRSMRDTVNTVELWQKMGIPVFCPDFGSGVAIDGKSMIGKMLLYTFSMAAEFEGDRVSQRMKDFGSSQKKMGRVVCGKIPYGYKKVRVGKPQGAKHQPPAYYQPAPEELAIAKSIRQFRMGGQTYEAISDHLNAHGFKWRDGTPWTRKQVVRAYDSYRDILAMIERAEAARKLKLQPWEYVTPYGVIAEVFDKLHLKEDYEQRREKPAGHPRLQAPGLGADEPGTV